MFLWLISYFKFSRWGQYTPIRVFAGKIPDKGYFAAWGSRYQGRGSRYPRVSWPRGSNCPGGQDKLLHWDLSRQNQLVPGHLVQDDSSHFFVRVISYHFPVTTSNFLKIGYNIIVVVLFVPKFVHMIIITDHYCNSFIYLSKLLFFFFSTLIYMRKCIMVYGGFIPI